MQPKLELLFFHGKPASGKDTQAEILSSEVPTFGVVSGVFRSAFTSIGMYAKYHDIVAPHILPLGKGIDIPGLTIANLLKSIIIDNIKLGKRGLIVCGLLRTPSHLIETQKWLSTQNEFGITTNHIYFATTNELSLERAKNRRIENAKIGNVRKDDDEFLFKARLSRWSLNTKPLLNMLLGEGELNIVKVNKTPQEVYRDTLKLVDFLEIRQRLEGISFPIESVR